MNKEEFLNNIEEYLNGHLTTTQATAFEQAMNGNVELQQTFQKRKETAVALKKLFVFESRKEELKRLIEVKEKEKRREVNNVRPLWPNYLRRLAAVLAIALFLGAAYWFLLKPTSPSDYQQLALSTFEQTDDKSLTGISPTMGGTNEVATVEALRQAKEAYKKGQAKEALDLLKNITPTNEQQKYEVILLNTLCQLKMENMVSAKQNLETLLQHPDQLYDDQVQWYSALIELHKGEAENISKAKQQLQVIISEGGTFRKEAQNLLDKL